MAVAAVVVSEVVEEEVLEEADSAVEAAEALTVAEAILVVVDLDEAAVAEATEEPLLPEEIGL